MFILTFFLYIVFTRETHMDISQVSDSESDDDDLVIVIDPPKPTLNDQNFLISTFVEDKKNNENNQNDSSEATTFLPYLRSKIAYYQYQQGTYEVYERRMRRLKQFFGFSALFGSTVLTMYLSEQTFQKSRWFLLLSLTVNLFQSVTTFFKFETIIVSCRETRNAWSELEVQTRNKLRQTTTNQLPDHGFMETLAERERLIIGGAVDTESLCC